jgi:hypothetical protein
MLLTKKERLTFADYLEQIEKTSRILCSQISKLNLSPSLTSRMAEKEMQLADACLVIIIHLRSAEDYTV